MTRRWPSDFGSLQQEMNDMLDSFKQRFTEPLTRTREGGAWLPPVNITETSESITLEAELPGVDPRSIDISVSGDTVTIKGEKKREEAKGERVHRVERSYGSFTRSFQLPSAIVADKVAADCKNGVLRVSLPKTDKSREVKVPVK